MAGSGAQPQPRMGLRLRRRRPRWLRQRRVGWRSARLHPRHRCERRGRSTRCRYKVGLDRRRRRSCGRVPVASRGLRWSPPSVLHRRMWLHVNDRWPDQVGGDVGTELRIVVPVVVPVTIGPLQIRALLRRISERPTTSCPLSCPAGRAAGLDPIRGLDLGRTVKRNARLCAMQPSSRWTATNDGSRAALLRTSAAYARRVSGRDGCSNARSTVRA